MEMYKYIEPTREHEEQMVEIRNNDTQPWQEARLLRVLDKPQQCRFICEDSGSREFCSKWKQARISVLKTPEEIHKESGFKVGDWVKVIVPKESKGFDAKAYTLNHYGKEPLSKAHEMNGKICQIVPGTYSSMFAVKEHGDKELPVFLLPCYFLEKVDPPEQSDEEIVYVPGTVEHWIYKGHAYRLATEADVGELVYRSDSDFKQAVGFGIRAPLSSVDTKRPTPYIVGVGWKFAFIQDDSLLKPALKEEYVPYTYEDIGSIMGKQFRAMNREGRVYSCQVQDIHITQSGMMIGNSSSAWLVKNATHLDENGNDTGIPFGKRVVR